MEIDFTSVVFRQLVKGYLWLGLLTIIVATLEFAIGPWLAFADEFDKIAAPTGNSLVNADIWLAIGCASLVAHFVGAVGLLSFKRWARHTFLWPVLGFSLFDVFLSGLPTFFTPVAILIDFIGSALFGAITLLAFGKNQGAIWFRQISNTGQ